MRLWLLAIGLSLAASPASAGDLEPVVLEFRALANGARVEALAWRRDGEIYVEPQTLEALGINASDVGEGPISLSALAVSHRFIASEQAVELACSSQCGAVQSIDLGQHSRGAYSEGQGGFLNAEFIGERIDDEARLAALFDLGLFNARGFGGTNWTFGAEEPGELVRLDTSWTFDIPSQRQRVRVGDGITPSSAGARPMRFAGVQWGTDFSLDTSFIAFPTPVFAGEATMPSTVDLYVDGALAARERINAGPFQISDLPIAGGGEARVVVTDVLGREQVIGAPFYASPLLLRPGLVDFSIASGVRRTQFGRESFHYSDGFALASYRRGLTDWATLETRAEIRDQSNIVGAGLAFARPEFGELSVFGAVEGGANADAMFSASWTWRGRRVNAGLAYESADEDYGLSEENSPRNRVQASLGLQLGDFGSVSLTAVRQDSNAASRVETLGLSYAPLAGSWGALTFTALHVDNGAPFTTGSISLVRPLGQTGSVGAALEIDAEGSALAARAQVSPATDGGWGWRVEARDGAREFFSAGVALRGRTIETSVEVARAASQDGLRGQFATAIAWVDGDLRRAHTIHDGFAIVDAGASNVMVRRDNLPIGRTDRSGRLLVTGLRGYDANRIGIDVDDLPLTSSVDADTMVVRIRERSGASISFDVAGGGGEVRIVDASGAPLAEGVMLVRDTDQARFPVGRDGRVYLNEAGRNATLIAQQPHACRVLVRDVDITNREPLTCVG